jgi:VWFA-related protein
MRFLTLFTFLLLNAVCLLAQGLPGGPGLGGQLDGRINGAPGGTAPFDISEMGISQLNSRMMWSDPSKQTSPLQNPALMVSQLDLKAPKPARKEFEKGFLFYNQKQYQAAVEHLLQAVTLYPEYVAARNALGSSYLGLSRNDEAREQFARAAVLDPHLPLAFLNLAYAETALRHYSDAEIAAQKAAGVAPLDLQVLTALAFAQLMNKDYSSCSATADKLHEEKEPGHAIVHFYSAAAWDHENDSDHAVVELKRLISEDPKSEAAAKGRELLDQLNNRKTQAPQAQDALDTPAQNPAETAFQAQVEVQKQQDAKELAQVSEAEAMCESCEAAGDVSANQPETAQSAEHGWTLHSDVDEVSVLFVATDHGKPIRDLIQSEITIRDAGKPPVSISAFRTESELPLHLGLVIDTSESVAGRFSFEQAAAGDFVRQVLTRNDDKAFVVGASNAVLLTQDFTSDNAKIADSIKSLTPAGGTALWDAASFAISKLGEDTGSRPVAKVLVLISDGRDNSSHTTLKEVIEEAERKNVTIYTVSTTDVRYLSTAFLDSAVLGDRALKNLAERTGGASFVPGSIGNLNSSLSDLQEFIRARYSLSYKPALLKHDDQYRVITISAQKSGKKLRVYARKGYYARASLSQNSTH